jgi:predicted enzyme related to lactoylglutathione lyase
MAPTLGNGKICYIEIPATDIARSAEFYGRVFGWQIRQGGDGSTAFDDGVGEVSGTWVMSRAPLAANGLMIHIMVDNMTAALDLLVANGGEIVQQVGADTPEITAKFRDPGGNVFGLYQEPG